MPTAEAELVDQVQPLFAALAAGDRGRAAALVRELVGHGLPGAWLETTAAALERGDFDLLSAPFRSAAFIGGDGRFLLIGPYTIRRGSGDTTRLSGLAGQVLAHGPLPGMAREMEAIQGAPLRQPINRLLPFRRIAACGNFDPDQGDAFVVPDGWGWTGSVQGPALNDMSEQGARFRDGLRRCIERVFDADTAALFVTPLDDDEGGALVRHRSYEIHDAGHASGLGLAHKVRAGLLPGYWYRAVEEWRADGIGFEVGARLLDERAAGYDLASNFCVRFGFDVPRASGLDAGTEHVPCAFLMLDRLLEHGAMVMRGERLALRDPSYSGLIRAMEPQRSDAIDLTRRELALESPRGVMRLYGSLHVQPGTEVVFDRIREACRDLVGPLV